MLKSQQEAAFSLRPKGCSNSALTPSRCQNPMLHRKHPAKIASTFRSGALSGRSLVCLPGAEFLTGNNQIVMAFRLRGEPVI